MADIGNLREDLVLRKYDSFRMNTTPGARMGTYIPVRKELEIFPGVASRQY